MERDGWQDESLRIKASPTAVRRVTVYEKAIGFLWSHGCRRTGEIHKKCLINGISQTMIPPRLSGTKRMSVAKIINEEGHDGTEF